MMMMMSLMVMMMIVMMLMKICNVLTDPGVHERHGDTLRVTLLLPFKDGTGDHLQLQLAEEKSSSHH